ncbi:MAG: hypothetical protein KA105_09810 [Caulobacter sp.]|nr:hypothetical protein [Caulobacter sp.]
MNKRDQAGRVGGETRPGYIPWHDLEPTTRAMIEETALDEIAHFGATGDAAAIERLAEDGRRGATDDEAGTHALQVSDYMDAVAARIRSQRAVLALFGGLAQVHKLTVR